MNKSDSDNSFSDFWYCKSILLFLNYIQMGPYGYILYLDFFTWHRVFELHSYWCKYEKSLFSLLHSIALHICPNNCLQILTKSSVDGHFGCFQFGPIMNNDAANIFCWSPFCVRRFSFLLDKCRGVQLLEHIEALHNFPVFLTF